VQISLQVGAVAAGCFESLDRLLQDAAGTVRARVDASEPRELLLDRLELLEDAEELETGRSCVALDNAG
jgi:hypothetical protein